MTEPKRSSVGAEISHDIAIFEAEWYLFLLVGGVLLLFYLIIAWVLRSSDNERKERLNKLG